MHIQNEIDSQLPTEGRRIEVRGMVQGIGFRPFVYGLACELNLQGSVWNHAAGVTIEAEGTAARLASFIHRLASEAPSLARIDALEVHSIPTQGRAGFVIRESEEAATLSTPISADICVCEQCLEEMQNPADRRFGYPFINCTHCGPRFTIIRDIPYDRPLTTMAAFEMCSQCATEYRDPGNRRFHAQPNACPECGPAIWFVSQPAVGSDPRLLQRPATCEDSAVALRAFQSAILCGEIIAVKGIGGFHLACDATNDSAVARLRERKGRVEKPFAVMVKDVATAREIAEVSNAEEKLLTSRERPIVLLKKSAGSRLLSPLVAPGNNYVGVVLPYSPLHYLLMEQHPALVMTSGNISEEPIVRTNQEACERLASLADAFLLHDREIVAVCDDSVVRHCGGNELPIRRSRGYAPLPIQLGTTGPSVLAVGGELKATFCVTKGDYAYLSQHIGDMANMETLQALERSVEHFCELFRVQPEVVACDMHPGYMSAAWAAEFASQRQVPLVKVQHHHAHIMALRTEHRTTEPVIGICFDGTGYGTDGAIWGGEVLFVSDEGCDRLAHLKYLPLPGGDACIRRPYRSALAHLWQAGMEWQASLPAMQTCDEHERTVLRRQLERNLNCIPTSSIGRLFDAVAALIGIRQEVTYEAQAALEMEALAELSSTDASYQFAMLEGSTLQFDPQPVLAAVVQDVLAGVLPPIIAGRLHLAVADLMIALCRRFCSETGSKTVALSGGVFQNVRLLELVVPRLEANGWRTLVHRQVPPNDGGIALGQAVIARATRH